MPFRRLKTWRTRALPIAVAVIASILLLIAKKMGLIEMDEEMKGLNVGSGYTDDDLKSGLTQTSSGSYIQGQFEFIRRRESEAVTAGAGSDSVKCTVVFLHGMVNSLKTWAKIKSLDYVVNNSPCKDAIAVNLPGYGYTSKSHGKEKASFIHNFFDTIKLDHNKRRIILITPSMSGQYTMPMLAKYGNDGARISGLVTIAPVEVSSNVNWTSLTSIRALILYGESDFTPMAAQSSLSYLKSIPYNEEVAIKQAGHRCYEDQPEAFHQILVQWLTKHFSDASKTTIKP